jgi:hypothetical protein
MMPVMNIMIDACDEYYDIYDIPVILGIFKREKQKK